MKQKFAVVAGAVLTSFALVACNQGGQAVQSSQNTNQTAVGNQTSAKGTTNSSPNAVPSGSNTTGAKATGANSTGSKTTSGSSGTSSSNTAGNSSATQSTQPTATSKTVKAQSGPLPGDLLIADRGNSRLLIVTPQKKIVWQMSIPNHGPKNANSLGADDAFFTPDGKHIIINEEDNQMIGVIDIATKKFVWTYGHPGVAGSAPGYLHTPDDAYMLPNGDVTVADIKNERVLVISPSGHIVKQYGTTGYWHHNPPKSFAAPNGDTPLPDGGMLVTEIGGSYADRLNKNGQLMYTVHFPNISYPSDSQLLPSGNILVVDYNTPGRAEIVNRQGHIVWQYYKTSGPGELRNPSLALPLANGDIVLNDDFNHRVVVIDPQTNKIVWQYGHTGVAGTAPGYLNTPDGLDIMPSNVKLPSGS